jgi:glycosyltransferase involved in cell wall biosynthesis
MDVGVLTSESEGLSNVLIEYALAGVPAVAFDIGGNREVIVPDVTGLLIEPFDEEQMTAKIEHLLEHPEQSMKMGAKAVAMSRERFSVDAMVRATERFYEEILAGPDKPEADGR